MGWTSALAATTVVLGVACGAASVRPGFAACDPTVGQQAVGLMNEARAERGLPPLRVDLRLVGAAGRHAADMTANDFVSHDGSDGSTASDRVSAVGYAWRWVSENVAAGQLTAAFVVDAWMNSEGHRANILSTRAAHVGVGYGSSPDTRFHHYWVANFGDTEGLPETPVGGCHP